MPNKPDWKDAPEWAQYLAMDEGGQWYWYEDEPTLYGEIWGCCLPSRVMGAWSPCECDPICEERPDHAK